MDAKIQKELISKANKMQLRHWLLRLLNEHSDTPYILKRLDTNADYILKQLHPLVAVFSQLAKKHGSEYYPVIACMAPDHWTYYEILLTYIKLVFPTVSKKDAIARFWMAIEYFQKEKKIRVTNISHETLSALGKNCVVNPQTDEGMKDKYLLFDEKKRRELLDQYFHFWITCLKNVSNEKITEEQMEKLEDAVQQSIVKAEEQFPDISSLII